MTGNRFIIILFILGLLIIAYPHIAQLVNNHIQALQVEQFQGKLAHIPDKVKESQLAVVKDCNKSLFENKTGLHDPFTNGYIREVYEGCTEALVEGDFFASLEIPRLDLTIPIYLGANDEILSRGVGQVEGSSLPIGGLNTHTVLAAHRGMGTKEMFRNIDVLEEGDNFYIHTVNGILNYEVYRKEVILPYETETLEIEAGKDLATLITCHPYRANSHRLLIHGERVPQY